MTPHKLQMCNVPLYRPAGCFLLRTPALPASTFQRLCALPTELYQQKKDKDLDTFHNDEMARLSSQLIALSSDPQIEQAIAVASYSLYEALVKARNSLLREKQARKAASGLLRYLIRMSTRPTPFGLFSGVALGSFESGTRGHLGTPSIGRFRSRPDMHWLLALVKHIEQLPEVFPQLSLYANQLATLTGDRITLSYIDAYEKRQQTLVSLRATSAVRTALALARQPILYLHLRDSLLQAFPMARTHQIERLLWQLWESGLLNSTLYPPLTEAHPAQYVLHSLASLQGVAAMHQLLSEVLTQVGFLDAEGVGGSLAPLTALIPLQNTLSVSMYHQPQIQVDSLLSLPSPTLSQSIGEFAARAAELLLRLSPSPQGPSHLQQYRHLFLEKYGPHAEVPVLELLSPEQGLGVPAGYLQSSSQPQRISFTPYSRHEERERMLHTLVQQALLAQSLSVALTDRELAHLQTWEPDEQSAPRSLEIYLHIQASSPQALDQGTFCAILGPNPGTMGAGRSFGRFADLFDASGKDALRQLLAREEALEPETLFAELSYQHSNLRSSNVALRPGLRTYEIAVGTTPSLPPEQVLPLSDLLVGVSKNRLYLRSRKHSKQVAISQFHLLTRQHAPAVCRFLAEVASDGLPILASFDWGSLSTAPFLPRLMTQIDQDSWVALCPARWSLQSNTIIPVQMGNNESEMLATNASWFAGLRQWRTQWKVPRYIYVTRWDYRLLLDLEHPLMAAELHHELARLQAGQTLTLEELYPDLEHLWLTDRQGEPYIAEIVVPLLRSRKISAHTHCLTRDLTR